MGGEGRMEHIIKYYIGSQPSKNTSKLYLFREFEGVTRKMATFASCLAAEEFADEFEFPLAKVTRMFIEEGREKWK